jgi:hypothetical protein
LRTGEKPQRWLPGAGLHRGCPGLARTIIEKLLETHPGDLYLTCRASLQPFYERFGFEAIETPQMPSYFRRISRLVRALGVLRIVDQKLLVMKKKAA